MRSRQLPFYLAADARGFVERARHARGSAGELDDATLVDRVESIVFRNRDVPKGRININAENVVFFQSGGMIVALWGRDQLAEDSGVEDGGGWGGVTLAHNVRSPEEVDAVIAEAEKAGARIE